MPVLDTNFLVALQARDPDAEALLTKIRGETLWVPSIVAAEYAAGFGDQAREALLHLEANFNVGHTGHDWVIHAAMHRNRLRAKGRPFRVADAWIAVWAVAHGTYVVTRDLGDFEAQGIPARAW